LAPHITVAAFSLWPTVVASDCYGAISRNDPDRGRNPGLSLTDAMLRFHGLPHEKTSTRGPDGLVLCPEFVEALMGLPEGWTRVADEPASVALGTPLSPSKPSTRSEGSGSDS
jgi:hypothetical protein